MEKNSTINPKLIPLKAFYEKLTIEEETKLRSLTKKELELEMQLLETLSRLPKTKKSPSPSSIDVILDYSKKQSRKDYVC